jgi:glycosyltransferase involved in cell wall biosynthesis
MTSSMRYLLVTHIPFARNAAGEPVVDALWARDLIGLSKSVGPIRVVAPEMTGTDSLKTWGHNSEVMTESSGVSFRGFPPMNSTRSFVTKFKIRSVLRQQVAESDVVHTSHFFPPYLDLAYAHDLAVRLGKKTLFVVAEDFHDILTWEWIRPVQGLKRWRRELTLKQIDQRVRKGAGTASLTLLHTPAAVDRYRLSAGRAVMIRQPGHESGQVISEQQLDERLYTLTQDRPLKLFTACRHTPVKGLDLLLRAIAILKRRGIAVELTMFGSGRETASLRTLTQTLDIEKEVLMPGSLAAGHELDEALRQGDLFVMPHRTTDFGRAFFDAVAAGLPVLAFRTQASIDTVYEGLDGFLTPLDDVQGLAERIASFHRDRQILHRASRQARQRALDNTRTHWFNMRADWTRSLLEEASLVSA